MTRPKVVSTVHRLQVTPVDLVATQAEPPPSPSADMFSSIAAAFENLSRIPSCWGRGLVGMGRPHEPTSLLWHDHGYLGQALHGMKPADWEKVGGSQKANMMPAS